MPDTTVMIRNELGEGEIYRFLCGVAHSDYVILRRLAMRTVEENPVGPVVERAPSELLRTELLPASIDIFARSARTYASYVGIDVDRFDAAVMRCYNELLLSDH